MAIVQPSLFKLLGAGFVKDTYAADGIHLRWMFDPRLGFPRTAVCLYRRPALGTREGNSGVPWHNQKWGDVDATRALDFDDLRIVRENGASFTSVGGIALSSTPLSFRFEGTGAGACYVRIHLRVLEPGGHATAVAEYLNRAEAQAVDRASLNTGARHSPLANLLERVPKGASSPKLDDTDEKQLYQHLLSLDAPYFRGVTQPWLAELIAVMRRGPVALGDLVRGGVYKNEVLVVRADRIDRVALTGGYARVTAIEWVTAAAYVDAEGWKGVVCVPAAGGDDDYVKRNAQHFQGSSPPEVAEARVRDPLPHGAEPLDEPVYPPTRPPTVEERLCRYLVPWRGNLAPWFRDVLQESTGGAKHMSQVTRTMDLTDLGQRPGDGVPAGASGSTMTVCPYNMLLAASMAFPVAQLLGLAWVDSSDLAHLETIADAPEWDYLARGRWEKADVSAWLKKLAADLVKAQQAVVVASPAESLAAQAALLEAASALIAATGELNALLTAASTTTTGTTSNSSDQLALCALKLGLRLAVHADFTAPVNVAATFEEASVIEPGMGIVRVDWPLRQRARVELDEAIPVGACIARGRAGEAYKEVLNPVLVDNGECRDVRAAVLPVGPSGAPGTAGTASHRDRAAGEGVSYHYGVSEMDPFGRWSPFADRPFRWEDRAAPPAPLAVQASLEAATTGLRLRVIFHWDRGRLPPAGFAFELGLRRDTTLAGGDVWPDDAGKPLYWSGFSRTLVGAASRFRILGSAVSGVTSTHDGLAVSVSFVDADIPDGMTGTAPRRIYTVDFTGPFEITRDAFLRGRLYVGVTSQKLAYGVYADEVAGPALAEHIDAAIPVAPGLPPEPQLASYADADGYSTFKLTWSGAANTRYKVMRAAERELITAVPATDARVVAWKAATSPAERAAQLRLLAPDARTVFAPVSDDLPAVPVSSPTGVGKLPVPPPIPASSSSYVDRLPGRADTLFVYTLLGRSASGEPSAWPTTANGFAAVRVPVASPPTQPVIVRAAWQPPLDPPPALAIEGEARAELQVLKPADGAPPVAYEIYRAGTQADAVDERRMRRIHVATPSWQDNGDGPDVARLIDPTVKPWTTYWYTVVARADGGSTPGVRSPASRPVAVETAAPAAPTATVPTVTTTTATQVMLDSTVSFPTAQLDRFRVVALRTSTSPREVVPITVAVVDATTLRLTVATADLVSGSTMVVRVTDPLGRSGESPALSVP